ncbi:MAG: methylated-DNA--[protein]-cysteine S-methyltransferase [Chitinophagaceae bacterium]
MTDNSFAPFDVAIPAIVPLAEQPIPPVDNFVTYCQSPVGLLRISGTADHVHEVHFVDNSEAASTPAATPALPVVAKLALQQVQEFIDGSRRIFDFPIRQQGTPFQQIVWQELVKIPFGKTISYLELSRRLGDPKVIRAAASANGKNQLAIVVPCHRVIGSNNDLIGYAGGLWRKKWLLDHENKIANGVQTLF